MTKSTGDKQSRWRVRFSRAGFNKRAMVTVLIAIVVTAVVSSVGWVVWKECPGPSARAFAFAQSVFALRFVKMARRATVITSVVRKVCVWIGSRNPD